MKENVKIFATPEAYELLTSLTDGISVHQAVECAVEMAQGKHGTCDDFFIDGCPLALSAMWSKNPNETSFILIDKHEGHQLFYMMHPSSFFEHIERSIPISLS